MKQINTLKLMLAVAFLSIANMANGQIHPLAFGTTPLFPVTNWYKDYVGFRFEVTTPAVVAGDKIFTAAYNNTPAWGGVVTTPIINTQVVMPQAGDSQATVAITTAMAGKIALIYRGTNMYADKALAAQTAGAVACVIVNNIPGGPVGMGAGTVSGSVTIPVFMISKADGDAIDVQYCSGIIVKMTITPWGQNNANDLGFVPEGIAGWHSYAIPHNQLFSSGSPAAYKGMDGAFIANYGAHNATHVKVSDTLRYTPTGGAASVIHTDVSPTLALFTPADSIYTMLAPAEYDFAPTGSGNGRFDLQYTISSDSADQYTADNTATYSFYTTDSVYSKGQYDFTNNVPERSVFEAPNAGTSDFMWGPMYYVAHGGAAISSVQFSIASNTTGPISAGSMNMYALKWIDGSGGEPLDGIVQNGELSLVSLGIYTFSGTDTSGGTFKVQMGDPGTGVPGPPILLDANAWYYIAADVPGGYFLGCDGYHSPYPRIYSRYHASTTIDYSSVIWVGDYSTGTYPMTSYPAAGALPCPFTETYYINSIDSFNYNSEKGMIPAIALIVNNNPSFISGPDSFCVGATAALTDIATGGTWSSSSTGIATVGTTGIVTGVSAGPATISYTLPSGVATKTVTVNALPLPIGGTMSLCTGASVTLTDATTGGAIVGTWSSSNTAVAVIVAGTDDVSGIIPGTSIITYTLSTGCAANTIVTVNPLPPAISGPSSVCQGSSITLIDAATGGTWSSSSTSVASIGAGTGIATGGIPGTSIITFTLAGCASNTTITVNPIPSSITGTLIVCTGSTTALGDVTTGGTWGSSNTAVAAIVSGTVTGVSGGTALITYALSDGCYITAGVAVNTSPDAGTITGAATVCPGATISLSESASGGTWSTSDATLASVNSSGVVSGIASGVVTISYVVTNTCGTANAVFTVNILLASSCPSYVNNTAATPTSVKVFPNPNDGAFTLLVTAATDEQALITITNVVGEKVKEFTIATNQAINVKLAQPSGIYFISVATAGGRYVTKVMVE